MTKKRTRFSASRAPEGGAGQASIDGVLEYAGVAHPGLAGHLLTTLGVLVLSLCSPTVGPLLPIPLYSCWGAKQYQGLPDSPSCQGSNLLPTTTMEPAYYTWDCSESTTHWWRPLNWRAACLVTVKVLLTLASGICMDVYGRRRVAIVSMGVFFVYSFTRTFAPTNEVAIMSVVMEGAAAQTAVIALLMIVLENSIQKECVRSVCLALVGHSLAVGGLAPTIDTLLARQTWQQLARSGPSAAIIIFIWWLPGSVRWELAKGDWSSASFLFPKTHNVLLDQTMKPKLMVVQQECDRCLSSAGCSSSALRQSVGPVLRTRQLLRIWCLGSLCAGVLGLTVGTRVIVDPTPYNSPSERGLAYGSTELLVLLLIGLTMSRMGAKSLVVISMAMLATATALTTVTRSTGASSCTADVILSLVGHGSAVMAVPTLMVCLWRLTPTHSRGAITGMVWFWTELGFAVAAPFCDTIDSLKPRILQYSLKAYVCAACCLLAALSALLLPSTPSVLPDALSHIRGYKEREKEEHDVELDPLENTRL